VSAFEPPDIGVTPPDVAAWLRARTQDSQAREVGLWTEDTRPNVGQVEVAIKQAHAMVAMRVGWEVPGPCMVGYRYAVALAAACIIEKSYFPEQIANRRSAYDELNAELEVALTNLLRCVVDGGFGPGDTHGAEAYSICTPVEHCGDGARVLVPANWNEPDPEVDTGATDWLTGHQDTWRGEVTLDRHGNRID
jgi:hypothetical protein